MQNDVYVFFRKPMSLKEIESGTFNDEGQLEEAKITEQVILTAQGYDDFTSNFMLGRPWLDGKGGFKNKIRQVIRVTAPEREDLFIDPEGYSYARYVGFLAFDGKDD